jgi:Holliday junction resolvase-like predicted endonuclease
LDVYVTKADGSKQLYDREKIVQTSLRLGADRTLAEQIARRLELKLYEGIPTRRILQLVFSYMRKTKPAVVHLFDLRRGISFMEPKPEFEMFVRALLTYSGYTVQPNRVLRGLCGEHEVDAIAEKDGLTYFVEAKHHEAYHAFTGLDESRIARAILEDVTEGYIRGTTDIKIDSAIIVTNTKYSDHAATYGACRGIIQIGWATPIGSGVRDTVMAHRLYPLSCIRGLSEETRMRLVGLGIVLVRQLLEQDRHYLERQLGLSPQAVCSLLEKATHTTETLWQR